MRGNRGFTPYSKAKATQHTMLMAKRYQCLTTVLTMSGKLISSLGLFCVDESMDVSVEYVVQYFYFTNRAIQSDTMTDTADVTALTTDTRYCLS